jgi:uncharacterized membrane protein
MKKKISKKTAQKKSAPKKPKISMGVCQITGKRFPLDHLVPGFAVRKNIVSLIKKDYPDWKDDGMVSSEGLDRYRHQHVKNLLEEEAGKLSRLEKKVLKSIQNSEILSKNIEPEIEEEFTLGEKIADKVAEFGGSWPFIIIFFAFLTIWMGSNIYLLAEKPFDPYPFILLNLVLSSLAAIQAPIIMMSQNRQGEKDRLRSEHDYQVNLKAELEIQQLHEKLDHMMVDQGQRLLEIQDIQIDLMEGILQKLRKR